MRSISLELLESLQITLVFLVSSLLKAFRPFVETTCIDGVTLLTKRNRPGFRKRTLLIQIEDAVVQTLIIKEVIFNLLSRNVEDVIFYLDCRLIDINYVDEGISFNRSKHLNLIKFRCLLPLAYLDLLSILVGLGN